MPAPTDHASLFPALEQPDGRDAIRVGDRTLDDRALARAAAAHAARLEAAGLRQGDHVAVWAQPALETLVALIGNALAGVVSVPLNAALGERELEHVLRDAAPRRVFAAAPATLAAWAPAAEQIELAGDAPARAVPDDDAPMLVVYTSGTTGAPKGAVLTRRNVASNVDALADAWAWTERDVLVHALPVFHVHGLVLGLFGAVRRGAALRWHARFEPDAIAAEFADGATMLFAVPTMYHRLAEAAERRPGALGAIARARLLVSGSAPLPVREHARLERAFGQRVVERYGLTETLINTSIRADGERRAGYVGAALRGVELGLVDDAGQPLGARDDATIGEVRVRGPNVFAGYLDRPDATAAVRDAEGWFRTGDLATIAPDGYVRIVGRRATDLIKTGGFKVGAGEVEAALLEHASVREAAVLGIADDALGERIVAFVVPSDAAGSAPDAQALIDHVARWLAPHKRPRVVHFVDALPRNAMGKVLKPALRARAGG